MSIGMPDKVQVEVVVQSRCFCCYGNPKSDSPKKSTLSQKLTYIFKSSNKPQEDPTPMRARTTSFMKEE